MTKTQDHEIVSRCPWCDSKVRREWGIPVRGFLSMECSSCGLIYVSNRLNADATKRFYDDYYTAVHQLDDVMNEQRFKMYQLEFDLIHSLVKGGRVLDVGCSGGQFLDLFKNAGYTCHGIEFGKQAAREAAKKHMVYEGSLLDYNQTEIFDLIIFRGVIEHVPDPRSYLRKALQLLSTEGYVYITSTPNADAFCAGLFHEQWNQHEPEAHIIHFSPRHFDGFFRENGLRKIWQQFFYEETPYCNIEEDILSIAKAIALKRQSLPIHFRSPAFFGNMMSLVYRKG